MLRFWTFRGIIERETLPLRFEKWVCDTCNAELYQGPTEFKAYATQKHDKFEDLECSGVLVRVLESGELGITPGEPPSLMGKEMVEGGNDLKAYRSKADFTKKALKYVYNETGNNREETRKRRDEINKNHGQGLVGGKI